LYVNKIYLVDESTWTYTDITPTGIVSGHMWTVVDMFGAWVLTNGSCVVWTKTPVKPDDPTATPQLGASTSPTASCCCRFKGQAFFAGTPTGSRVGIWENLGPNFVFWTDIGGGDTYMPWDTSSTDLSDDRLRSMVRQNLLGNHPMPSPGKVLRVEALKKAVMVYSEDSINALRPGTVGDVQAYGLVELHDIGIQQRGFVAAGRDRHYYVTEDGNLWSINSELQPQLHGFNWISNFNSPTGTWIGAFDEANHEAYFSNGITGFLITVHGVTDAVVFPTSIVPRGGSLYAPTKDYAGGTDFSLITTSPLRYETEANVTLALVEAGIRGITAAYVTPHADYGSGMSTRSVTFNLNKNNVAHPRTTAPRMQVSLTGTVAGSQKIDFLRLEIQYSDRRFRRGVVGGKT
jgi:hypothetical protein